MNHYQVPARHVFSQRDPPDLALAVFLALADTWIGIALAYVTDWPTTFWIVVVSCLFYFVSAIKRTTRSTGG